MAHWNRHDLNRSNPRSFLKRLKTDGERDKFLNLLPSILMILIKNTVLKVLKSYFFRIFIQNFDFLKCLHDEINRFHTFFHEKIEN